MIIFVKVTVIAEKKIMLIVNDKIKKKVLIKRKKRINSLSFHENLNRFKSLSKTLK